MTWDEQRRIALATIIFALGALFLAAFMAAQPCLPSPGGVGTTPATGSHDRGRTI